MSPQPTAGPVVKPIPARTNRQIRIAVSTFFFCQGLCFATWASRIPDIKSVLHLSDAALGTILFALPAGQLTAMPFSGRLVTKYGSRNVIRISVLFYAFCLTNIGLAFEGWHLALALYLFGVCGNMCNISVNTQAIITENLYGRPIMTSFHGVWSTAGVSGAGIGWLMTSQRIQASPYLHFWIVAVTCMALTLFAQQYLNRGQAGSGIKRKLFSKPDPVLLQLGVIAFCSMASEGAMFDWSGVYFKDVVHAPSSMIVFGYLIFMTMMASGRFVGDKLVEKYGRKKLLQCSGVLISSGLFISVMFPQLIPAAVGFLIVGFGVSSVVPLIYSSAGKVSHIPPGNALATVSSISFLGFLMGPPLIGYISELFSLRHSFAVIGLFGICITIMVSRMRIFRLA